MSFSQTLELEFLLVQPNGVLASTKYDSSWMPKTHKFSMYINLFSHGIAQ